LAEEACFDLNEASHALSLCDMHTKYADVMKVADVPPISTRSRQDSLICSPVAGRFRLRG
jgi:hypothetical protein